MNTIVVNTDSSDVTQTLHVSAILIADEDEEFEALNTIEDSVLQSWVAYGIEWGLREAWDELKSHDDEADLLFGAIDADGVEEFEVGVSIEEKGHEIYN